MFIKYILKLVKLTLYRSVIHIFSMWKPPGLLLSEVNLAINKYLTCHWAFCGLPEELKPYNLWADSHRQKKRTISLICLWQTKEIK